MKQSATDHPLRWFFLLVYAWTWGWAGLLIVAPGLVARVVGPVGPGNPLFYLAVYGPTLVAIFLTALTRGTAGVGRLLGRWVQWRFGIVWYALVLIGIPLLALVARHAGQWVFDTPLPSSDLAALLLWAKVFPVALLLDPGPIGEELGWRGFALPRMVPRWGAAGAAILLGLIWGVWHYPAFRIPGLPQGALNFPVFVMGCVMLSVIVAWLVVRTGGSVLIAVLFHAAINSTMGVLQPPFPLFVTLLGLVAVAIVMFDKGFRLVRDVGNGVP